jgi:hypothetical protein
MDFHLVRLPFVFADDCGGSMQLSIELFGYNGSTHLSKLHYQVESEGRPLNTPPHLSTNSPI